MVYSAEKIQMGNIKVVKIRKHNERLSKPILIEKLNKLLKDICQLNWNVQISCFKKYLKQYIDKRNIIILKDKLIKKISLLAFLSHRQIIIIFMIFINKMYANKGLYDWIINSKVLVE